MGFRSASLFQSVRFAAFLIVTFCFLAGQSHAAAVVADPDLPVAAASPMAGIGFDDRPLFLPVQKNFQMAMLTAGNEIGRTCGKMEAYGWRLKQSEQSRVNQIFNTTVDRFRGMGFVVEMQAPSSVSHDITMFTADRADKHFLSMWSAGEIGLVMVLCQTGASRSTQELASLAATATDSPAVPSPPSAPNLASQSSLASSISPTYDAAKDQYEKFSPIGEWVGSYICSQGYTGGTLTITKLSGEDFEGVFHFYPTPKNPTLPEGRYAVFGQYDRASQHILVNPGHWIQRPENYYNTILVGSFDPVGKTFSAYFQGINGCTSFEARQLPASTQSPEFTHHHKHAVKPKAKKKKVSSKTAKAAPLQPAEVIPATPPAPAAATPAVAVPAPAPAAVPAPAPAPAAAPAAPAPANSTDAAPLAMPANTTAAAPPAPSEPPPLVVGAPTTGGPAAPAATTPVPAPPAEPMAAAPAPAAK